VTAPAAAPASGSIAQPALRAAPQPPADPFAFAAVLDSLPHAPTKPSTATAEKQAHPSDEPELDQSPPGQSASHSLMSDEALLASLPFALQAASMTAERPESGAPSSLPTAATKGPESEGADASLAASAKAATVGRLIGERAFHFGPSASASATRAAGRRQTRRSRRPRPRPWAPVFRPRRVSAAKAILRPASGRPRLRRARAPFHPATTRRPERQSPRTRAEPQ
jgi:hypothetical protein